MKNKTLAILTALTLLASILVSCAAPASDTPSSVDTAASIAAETEAETEPSNADIIRAALGGTSFDSYEFRILSPKPGSHFYGKTGENENEIYYEAQTGEVLQDSIYRRNMLTEELLNVKISPVWANSTDEITNTLKKSVAASDDGFDLVLSRLDYLANSAADNLLLNLLNISAVNPENPWWDEHIVSNFTMFNTKLYLIAGDLNYYDDYGVQTVFYNKALTTDLGFEQLYDTVVAGNWTFDIMLERVKAAAFDINGDGKFTAKEDRYGYVNHSGSLMHLIYAFDETMANVDGDGMIQINNSENLVNVVDELYSFHHDNEGVNFTDNYEDYINAFKESRALFYPDMVGSLANLREMTDDFGILPMPKRDENQERYTAYVSNGWSTALSIPITAPDSERTGTVLEAMSAFSTDTVKQALYDILLQNKYIRDVESQEMLTFIWGSKAYDWAGDLAWASSLRGIYSSLLTAKENTFVSQMESKSKSIQKSLDKFIQSYEEAN